MQSEWLCIDKAEKTRVARHATSHAAKRKINTSRVSLAPEALLQRCAMSCNGAPDVEDIMMYLIRSHSFDTPTKKFLNDASRFLGFAMHGGAFFSTDPQCAHSLRNAGPGCIARLKAGGNSVN
jgi:hypothetical protein